MKLKGCLVSGAIATAVLFAAMFAASKILPTTAERAFPAIRASTKAFELTSVADGRYEGSSLIAPVSVKVKVTVENRRLSRIEIVKHFNGRGKPAEAIVDRVIEAQSLGVDIVAGATYSSLAILKAIEDALSKGILR